MSPWLIAACVLLVSLVGPLLVAVRRPIVDALIALELSGVVQTTVMLLLAEGFHRTALFDPAVVLAVMTFIGALVFARLMERHL